MGEKDPPCGECFVYDGAFVFIDVQTSRYGPDGEFRFAGLWVKREFVVLHAMDSSVSPAHWTPKNRAQMRIDMPIWMLAILLGMYPLMRCVFAARNAWTRRGVRHCSVCGYNLTGNTSGRCPECGTAALGARLSQP